jgi:hypothetical protein
MGKDKTQQRHSGSPKRSLWNRRFKQWLASAKPQLSHGSLWLFRYKPSFDRINAWLF